MANPPPRSDHISPDRRRFCNRAVPDVRRQFQIGAKEGRAEFGDKLLHGVPGITKPLAAEIAVKPRRVARPVDAFMAKGGVVAFGRFEALEVRHLHIVGGRGVEGRIAAVADVRARGGEEVFRVFDTLLRVQPGRSLGVVMRGQAFNLLDVEHGVALHEGDFPRLRLPLLARLLAGDGAGIDDKRPLLALLHMRAEFLRLLEGHPDRGGKSLFHRGRPQHHDVDAAVRFAVGA